ncbi:MAG: glycosyltransferase [Peptococcaceae bacterium]|nr:glycosyltransferase [Peptococcaceae bacterium]
MRILFTNPTPVIKYGMQLGFEKHGWQTARIEVPEQTEQGLQKKIDEFKPDYIFTEGGVDTKKFVFPVLEKTGIPHIFWAIEDPIASGLAMEWAGKSVLVLTPCIEMVENYRKNGHKAICVPFAVDPDYYYKRPLHEKFALLDAIHIGNNYDWFEERYKAYQYIIQPFIDKGKKIEIYGWDWTNPKHRFNVDPKYYKGYMAHEETVIAYSSAKIVLGVHSIVNSKTMQSMRTFEVLGCGGFFLTQHTKAIECMFENHKHLVWSESYEETVDLMNFYLKNDAARQKVAANGQKLVYEKHTYQHRVANILQALGLKC